jgi:ion channel-forming bestrophin family protein
MIPYDPKRWWVVFFSVRGTVLPRVGRRALGYALFCVALNGVNEWFVKLPELNHIGHTLLGLVLGLLIVFRTNTSYDRFWEGRKLWGSMVNTARNLARGAAVFAPPSDDLSRLLTAYVRAVKQHLRGATDLAEIKPYLSAELFERASAAANPGVILAWHLSDWVLKRRQSGRLDNQMASRLEGYVAALLDWQGGCERILKTPIPFVYAAHIKHLLLAYLVTLPFVLVPLLQWGAPVMMAVCAFGMLGVEEAGVEIEDPFGTDPNDLPLDIICETIARDAKALAEPPG